MSGYDWRNALYVLFWDRHRCKWHGQLVTNWRPSTLVNYKTVNWQCRRRWRCWRRLVSHHMTSVFDEFNWNLFNFSQLVKSLRQSEIDDEITLTFEGRHEPLIWLSSAWRCNVKLCSSISWMRSKVYKINSSSPRSDSCGTPHSRWVMSDRRAPRRTYCVRPTRCDQNHRCTLPSTLKVCCMRRNRKSWSMVSKAAVKSRRISAPNSLRSTACKTSDMTWKTVVFVEWPGRKPDCNVGKRSADDK